MIILVLCLLFWWIFRPKAFFAPQMKPVQEWEYTNYRSKTSVFTNRAELQLFRCLLKQKPAEILICPKVRLEDIVGPDRAIKDKRKYWKLRGRVKSRHVDFTICDEQGRYLCVVELDGRSHDAPSVREVDQFKNRLFQSIDLPIYRVQNGADFTRFSQQLWRDFTP